MSIKLLVVDDHPVVRLGLREMLAGSEIHVGAEAANGHEALALIQSTPFDLVLMDVRMPECDGLRCLAELKKIKPDLPVLMLSAYDSPTYVARAVALGAGGYLTKTVGREELISAVLEVAGGGAAWSKEHLRRTSTSVGEPNVQLDLEVPLTKRELEVLKQLSLGLTNKEIAEALSISYETVKEHVQHVLRKLGVSDRTQAAVWAVRRGFD